MSSGKLTMLRGLPASGKSSWAAQQKDAVVVTKDDIRKEINKPWSHDLEKEVLRIRDFRIAEALSKGKWVISADTNLAPKHEARLKGLSVRYKATFEVDDTFTLVPLEECLRRDSERSGAERVGEKVIRDMYDRFLAPKTDSIAQAVDSKLETPQDVMLRLPYVPKAHLPKTILCDLDGTLSLFEAKGHRGPYDGSKCDRDDVNVPVLEVLRAMQAQDYKILFMSGREDQWRSQTVTFLSRYGLEENILYMRETGDKRKDSIVKLELFDRFVRNRYNILFVFDDRQVVVDAWRSIGLTVFQVAPGAF